MNAIETLLDKPIFQALGWTLIHFIWQGALIAVLYASVSVLLRRFTSNIRYAAACFAMLLMVIAPATTMLAISSFADRSPAGALTPEITTTKQASEAVRQFPVDQFAMTIQSEIAPAPQANLIEQWAQEQLPRAMPWLLALWFAGVLFLSLRFAGGLVMVHRLKQSEINPGVQLWKERVALLSRRLRVSRPVRLCESALVEVPTVIGWLRPLILLPSSAITGLSAEQLEAVLAHELAHIRRYDYLVNLLQTTIETLFFYHPAVWWVSAQVRQEREHCCDDLAVAACGDVLTYARALTALEQRRGSEPQLAVAATGGSLLVRIQRLLGGRPARVYGFESGLAGLIALATIFILLAGAQTTLLSRNAKAAAVSDAAIFSPPDQIPRTVDRPSEKTPPAAIERRAAGPITTPSDANATDETADAQDAASPADSDPIQERHPGDSNDFISELAAAGLTNLREGQLVALKVNGVTTQFVREMSALGSTRLTVERIVALRIHGVTAAFAEELKAQGLLNLNLEQLIAFRIHGVTSQYIGELKNAGFSGLNPDSLVAFRIHGVTPALIQQMKDIGFDHLTADQLAACGVHGVTPLFVQTMRSFIRGKLTIDDLLALRIHGVTPEMIKELEIIGYSNLSADQLTGFRIHGVTPAYIKSIQEAGYDHITADQLVELRIHGVTAEFIQMVKSRGFADVTLRQLVELRRLNILPSAPKN